MNLNPLLGSDVTKIVVWDVNSSVWHLHGQGAGREGARITAQEGWMFAPTRLITSSGARQDGVTVIRSVRDPKEWDFDVLVSSRSGTVRGFWAVHDKWFRGWNTDRPCTVGWYTRYQGWRYQQVQLDAQPKPVHNLDPALNGAAVYQMSALAADPLERHLVETDIWVNSAGLGEGILRGRNAADQPAWPRYTMNGPGRWAIEDPIGGETLRVVETPLLAEGEELRIDTHPRHRTARTYSEANPTGENAWPKLGGRRWLSSLPPWSSTDLIVRVTEGATLESTARMDVYPRSSRPV